MNKDKIKVITIISILIALIISLSFIPSKKQTDREVIDFSQRIIELYRLKKDYSGMIIKEKDLFAGDVNEKQLGFGAKSFYITKKDISQKKCVSLLLAHGQEDLSLIDIKINQNTFTWGKGLPLSTQQINESCQKTNTITWQFL